MGCSSVYWLNCTTIHISRTHLNSFLGAVDLPLVDEGTFPSIFFCVSTSTHHMPPVMVSDVAFKVDQE